MIRPINFHIMSTTAHNAIEQVEFFQDLRMDILWKISHPEQLRYIYYWEITK